METVSALLALFEGILLSKGSVIRNFDIIHDVNLLNE